MYAYGSAGSSDAHVRAQFAHATKAVAFGVGLLKFRAGERSSIRAAKLLEILRVVDDMQPQLRVLAAAPASGAASACILQALQFQQDALAEMIRVARSLGWESDARMIETAVAGTFPGEPPTAAPRYAGQEAAPRQNEGVPGIHLLRETAPAPAAPAHEGASAPSSELATVVAALTALTGQLAASMRAMEANRVVPYPMLPAYAPAVVAPPPNWTPPRPAPAAIADDDPGDDEDEHPRRARRAPSARRSGGLTTTRLAGSGVVIGFLALLGGISLANRMLVETSVASANASATPETGKPIRRPALRLRDPGGSGAWRPAAADIRAAAAGRAPRPATATRHRRGAAARSQPHAASRAPPPAGARKRAPVAAAATGRGSRSGAARDGLAARAVARRDRGGSAPGAGRAKKGGAAREAAQTVARPGAGRRSAQGCRGESQSGAVRGTQNGSGECRRRTGRECERECGSGS
jgi:hypothetical protein